MQIKEIRFTVPGEPVGKGRPRFVRSTGRAYTPDKTARYENLVAVAFKNEFPRWTPIEEPITLTMIAYFSIPKSFSKKKRSMAMSGDLRPTKKPDTDNIAKIKDALNNIAWHDDAQVVTETIEKRYSDNPRLEVTIEIMKGEDK